MMHCQSYLLSLIRYLFCRSQYLFKSLLFVLVLSLFSTFNAIADETEIDLYQGNISFDTFKLQNMDVGIYMINGQLKYELSDYLHESLNNGVTLQSKITFDLIKPRRFWLDGKRSWASINTTLRYHALSQHYQVIKDDTEEHWNFKSLRSALLKLGEIQGYRLPEIPGSSEQARNYSISVFATLTPSSLSFPMQIESFFIDKYALKTTGLAWPLP